ncbi:MAG: hypothetical protein FWH43_04950 [Endomicrobia bacterium]|nr:hypothetical protein [Endomicrobiia bacterium]
MLQSIIEITIHSFTVLGGLLWLFLIFIFFAFMASVKIARGKRAPDWTLKELTYHWDALCYIVLINVVSFFIIRFFFMEYTVLASAICLVCNIFLIPYILCAAAGFVFESMPDFFKISALFVSISAFLFFLFGLFIHSLKI